MKFTSISQKLVLTISLFISLILVLIVAGTYYYFQHTTRELIFSQQFEILTRSANMLDEDITTAHKALIELANATSPSLVTNSKAAESWLQSQIASHTIFSENMVIFDSNGVMVATNPPRPDMYGSSRAHREYFTKTMNSGKPLVSMPFISESKKQPAIMLTAPIRGTDGSIKGVLCGRVDLFRKEGLFSSIQDVRRGSNGYLYLFASDRTIIMHPDKSRIMKQDVKPGVNKLFDRALEGFEGSGETINSKGFHVLASFKRLQTNGWILGANYPAAEAYQPITRFRNYFLSAMLATLLAAIALTSKLGVMISRPLTTITDQINSLSQPGSDKGLRLDSSSADELGQLAGSFNNLLDEIQRNEKELKASSTRFQQMFEGRQSAEEEALNARHVAEKANDILSSILESMADWVWEVDSEGRYTYCSPHVETYLGYTPDEMIGKTPFDFMCPDEAERISIQFIDICQQKQRIQNLENWNITKDGRRILLSTNGVPILDEAGNLRGYRGVDRDITNLKSYEDNLRKLSRAIEQCPVSIVITDAQGKIEFVNPRFTESTGYRAEEAIGQNPRMLNSGQTPAETFLDLWANLQAGNTWEGEFHNKRKDGSMFWEQASISALRDTNGAITHYLAVKEDITEKKRITEQLVITKEEAEAATTAKSSFLATMSHEIRTPMNGIIGMTSLLLDTNLNEEQREYAEIVRKSGENLLNLINEILDFSKIEAGKLDLEILDFDLRITMEDTAEMLALRASNAGLELICHIDPAVPQYLRGDPGRIRQIITNLAGNAIKFTHQGEVVISAKLTSDQDGFATILFEIHDTGIGIPPERLDAVFDPFTQVDGSTTRKYGGTGLGLAICKQLAELMGGEIGVTSEEGHGSTFWFSARFEKQPPEVIQTSGDSLLSDISGVRILVIDDNETNRKLLKILLNHWGCLIEVAADAETGLALLLEAARKGDPFQIALLDYEMPGMDGLALGSRIKSDPLLESTAMVMVTSLGQRGDAAVLERTGFVGYLTKPVRQSLLHDCIALVLGRTEVNGPPGKPQGIVTRFTVAEHAERGDRILLAEDNIINQKVAQQMLSKLGYKADVVADGQEAVRALEMINYDLVLMDCQMPNMDGFEATAMIRNPDSNVLNHTVPIIAMTANAMQGDRERCIAAGMDDYLPKPVKKDALAEALGVWLKKGVRTDISQDRHAAVSPGIPILFDKADLLDRFDGDLDFAQSILDDALNELPEDIKALREHVTGTDMQALRLLAHTMKGVAANICTPALRELCFSIETAAKNSDQKSVQELLPELERTAMMTIEEIRMISARKQ